MPLALSVNQDGMERHVNDHATGVVAIDHVTKQQENVHPHHAIQVITEEKCNIFVYFSIFLLCRIKLHVVKCDIRM